jgi:hypothetical protein
MRTPAGLLGWTLSSRALTELQKKKEEEEKEKEKEEEEEEEMKKKKKKEEKGERFGSDRDCAKIPRDSPGRFQARRGRFRGNPARDPAKTRSATRFPARDRGKIPRDPGKIPRDSGARSGISAPGMAGSGGVFRSFGPWMSAGSRPRSEITSIS